MYAYSPLRVDFMTALYKTSIRRFRWQLSIGSDEQHFSEHASGIRESRTIYHVRF